MIHSLSSSLATFKRLEFRPGLNVLLAEKEKGASAKQTRNRAGKSSVVEIVHFLLGSEAKAGSLCVQPALREWTFELNLDLAGVPVRVGRTGGNKSKVVVDAPDSAGGTMLVTNSDWSARLGREVFGLKREPKGAGRAPTFRSLLPYFARRQSAHGFNAPEQHTDKQQAVEQEMGLLFLLGLDWRIASDWQSVRDRENTLMELKKAAMAGDLGTVVGKTAVLRTELTLAEDQLAKMQGALKSFQVLPQFRELEREANELTRALNALSDADVADNAALRDLDAALTTETPPGSPRPGPNLLGSRGCPSRVGTAAL